jgi:hypothetical protein
VDRKLEKKMVTIVRWKQNYYYANVYFYNDKTAHFDVLADRPPLTNEEVRQFRMSKKNQTLN